MGWRIPLVRPSRKRRFAPATRNSGRKRNCSPTRHVSLHRELASRAINIQTRDHTRQNQDTPKLQLGQRRRGHWGACDLEGHAGAVSGTDGLGRHRHDTARLAQPPPRPRQSLLRFQHSCALGEPGPGGR
eukprot:1186677-Rhodomonas_salina.2